VDGFPKSVEREDGRSKRIAYVGKRLMGNAQPRPVWSIA